MGRLRKVLVVLFVCLTAFYISRGLISIVASGFGVGNVIRAFFPGILCMVGLMFFARPDLFPLGFRSRKIGLKEGLFISSVALLVALSPLLQVENLTHLLVLLIALIGVLMTLYLIATRDNVWGIVAFLFTVPFLSYIQWEIPFLRARDEDFITVSYVAVLLVMGMTTAHIVKKGIDHFVRTSLDKYILAFFVVLLLSSVTSPDPSKSFRMFFQLVITISVFYLVSNHIHTKKDIMVLLEALVFFGVFKCFLYGYFHWKGLEFSFMALIADRGGLVSSMEAPLALSGPIPIAISLAILYSSRSMKWVYYTLATLVFLFFIFVSQTRGLLVTLAIGAPMILCYRRGKRWLLFGLIAGIFTILVFGTYQVFFRRYEELMSIQGWEAALAMRVDGWRAALGMMRDHPFTGIGLDMWGEFIHLYGTPYEWVIEGQRIYIYIASAHNGHLHYGAEAGVIAILLSFLIILKAQFKIFSILREVKDDNVYTIAVGLAWSCIGMLIWGITSYAFGYLDYAMESWSLMAIIMGLERISQMDSPLIGDQTIRERKI